MRVYRKRHIVNADILVFIIGTQVQMIHFSIREDIQSIDTERNAPEIRNGSGRRTKMDPIVQLWLIIH